MKSSKPRSVAKPRAPKRAAPPSPSNEGSASATPAPSFAAGDARQAMGRLAAGIAHDFNNLLTSILGFGHILREMLPPESEMRDYAAQIVAAGERAADLVRQMLSFSSQQPAKLAPVDLNATLRARQDTMRENLGPGVVLDFDLESGPFQVNLDLERWNDLLDRLARNAGDAMRHGGRFVIRCEAAGTDQVRLEFRDNGEGMDDATTARMFEPFFSTRETHQRPGLGLSIVYVIVEQHGGRIEVRSRRGAGTSLFITLPLAEAPARSGTSLDSAPRGTERILLVDDEDAVRQVFSHHLISLGYQVCTARDAGDALDLLANKSGCVDLLLTDIAMPGVKVEHLVAEARRLHPSCQILYTSGYPQGTLPADRLIPAAANFLQKPCSRDVLARAVRQVLDEPVRAALAPRVV